MAANGSIADIVAGIRESLLKVRNKYEGAGILASKRRTDNFLGGRLNTQLKRLIKELGEAINGSLSESQQIAQVIAKIKEEGYDIFLVLEATLGFNRHDEENPAGSGQLVGSRRRGSEPEFSITAHDVRFLKSLRISVDRNA